MTKLLTVVFSFLYLIRFFLTNHFSSKSLISNNNRRVINVSLTTHGDRLDKVYLTLESIAVQSVKPDSLTLWLSKDDFNNKIIPSSLRRLKKRGLNIRWVDENIKSYKKIYYTYCELKNEKNIFIVTIDDDVYYTKHWLKNLRHEYEINKGVICSYARVININQSMLLPYSTWNNTTEYVNDEKLLLPIGVGGVLYPIESLKGLDTQKEYFCSIAPFADDLWLKFLHLSNGYGAFLARNADRRHPIPIISSNMKGLEKYNVLSGGNDIQVDNIIEFFKVNLK